MHVCQELNNVGRPGTRYPSGLYNDDAMMTRHFDGTPISTSSVAHQDMLTCTMRIVRITCMNIRQRSLTLPLTLAPPRAHSTNRPTHWATASALASNCVVHVQRHLCAWQAQACVTVRHVRVGAAGGAGAAGAAHTTSSRHMLVAVFASSSPAESFKGV